MPINTTHTGYNEAMKKVGRVRDFAAVSDAIKGNGDTVTIVQ